MPPLLLKAIVSFWQAGPLLIAVAVVLLTATVVEAVAVQPPATVTVTV